MGIKVIFLDIDGVLNTYNTKSTTSTGTTFVDDNKVKILKDIVDRTNAKIVLSSTWRIGWRHVDLGIKNTELAKDFICLRNKFRQFDIRLYGKTPIYDRFMSCRGEEIKAYLDKNKEHIDGYVIIDDLDGKYLRPCSSHLLQTSEWKGLQEKHIKVAEKILNMEV